MKEFKIHRCRVSVVVNGRWEKKIEERPVRVMARAEGYAMVRRKGAMPYCVSEKELVEDER